MHRFVSMLKYQNVSDDHLLLGSEACHCPSTGYAGGDLNVAWARAERYAHTILSDLAAGSQGWVEWNMVLDSIGGPNHLGNMCDAPLLAVSYRVGGKHNVSELPYFEQSDHPFGPVAGDARTREELHAMGMPAEYLDRGVVVQPMYYYMGHISRHVRPGSRAVKALVDHTESDTASRTFRQNSGDSFIAGGGINNLSRAGVEVTLWPCEGSTRQEWAINEKGQFAVFGHDWLGAPTTSCVGKIPDESFHGLLLTDCDDTAGSFRTMALNETLSTINIMVTNSDRLEGDNCVVALPLQGNGGATGARGGAQITIGKCAAKSVSVVKNDYFVQ
jgi:glucosylceramidase